jgi:hypothetical protein
MTVAAIGIVLLLCSTSVQATATIRPIEDWQGEEIVGWGDPESELVIHPHTVEWDMDNMPFNFVYWQQKTVWECDYKGFVQERVIDDEHTLITINLHVKEVPFIIFNFVPSYVYTPPIYYGVMKYYFQIQILFNTESLYNILGTSGKIPSLFMIFGEIYGFWPYPEEPIPTVTYMHFVGQGYLTEGGEGKVMVNQVGIFDFDIGDFVYPVEIVTVN